MSNFQWRIVEIFGGLTALSMRKYFLASFASICLFALCVGPGCNERDCDQQAIALLMKAQDLEERHDLIENEIDSLWDLTTAKLALGLPDHIPPSDRDIFLKSRNADHMRMFMSFDKLDRSLQELVIDAGRYDQVLASKIRILSNERLAFEKEKLQFLKKIKQNQGEVASRKIAEKLRLIASS